jgi:formate dehydrogenase subunit delta
MTDRDIARMANQIAAFFAVYPHEEAVEGVARHMRDFWDPRMRAALADFMARGAPDLDPLAAEGARRLLAPPQTAAA